MKIAVVGTRGFPGVQGGVEAHCEQLYPRLAARGCEVVVFTRKPYVHGDNGAYRGVRLIAIACPKQKYLEAVLHTLLGVLYARRLSPDLLHIHAIGPSLFAPLARLLGLRVVMTHHGPDYERKKWGRFAKRILRLGEAAGHRFAHRTICISEPIAAGLNGQCPTPPVVIPNGVEMPRPAASRAALETFGLEPKRYLLAVGRLVPEKGFHDLIEAFARLGLDDRPGELAGWKLVIVGCADHETPYSRALTHQARAHPRVVLTGFLTGTPLSELYSHAGVFVLPSSYEGCPLVLLEAMSYGLPCVVSDVPATRGMPLPVESYCRAGDVPALVDKLRVAMRTPAGPGVAQAQRDRIAEGYSWEAIADRTLETYRSVLGNGR